MPLIAGERLIGVLDLDSPTVGRFGPADAALLLPLAAQLVAACDWRFAGIDGF